MRTGCCFLTCQWKLVGYDQWIPQLVDLVNWHKLRTAREPNSMKYILFRCPLSQVLLNPTANEKRALNLLKKILQKSQQVLFDHHKQPAATNEVNKRVNSKDQKSESQTDSRVQWIPKQEYLIAACEASSLLFGTQCNQFGCHKLTVMFWPSFTHFFQEPSEPGTAYQILPFLHLPLKNLNPPQRSV